MDEVHLSEAEQVARTRTPSGRSLDQYLAILQLLPADLQGKKILDLGCGPDCRLAKELQQLVPSARVTSFDACFLTDDFVPASAVGGYFGALPFDDHSFDIVLSLFACPLYCEGEELVSLALSEICRVLSRRGKAYLAPLAFHLRFDGGEIDSSLSQKDIALSRTIVKTEKGLRETVLDDVSYGSALQIFDRILEQLPAGYHSKIIPVLIPDVAAEYQYMVEIARTLTPNLKQGEGSSS